MRPREGIRAGAGVNLYRLSADHSGKTVSYDVDKDGNMIKK